MVFSFIFAPPRTGAHPTEMANTVRPPSYIGFGPYLSKRQQARLLGCCQHIRCGPRSSNALNSNSAQCMGSYRQWAELPKQFCPRHGTFHCCFARCSFVRFHTPRNGKGEESCRCTFFYCDEACPSICAGNGKR